MLPNCSGMALEQPLSQPTFLRLVNMYRVVIDYRAGRVFVAEELIGSEGGFVEVDGFGSVADGEERGEGGLLWAGAHGSFSIEVSRVRDSRFARMPTHPMKLHEWGTQKSGLWVSRLPKLVSIN